jgi:hypothetical protein
MTVILLSVCHAEFGMLSVFNIMSVNMLRLTDSCFAEYRCAEC